MTNYSLVEKDYTNKDDIEIKITNTQEVVSEEVISLSNIKQRITNLEAQKAEKVADFDAKINALKAELAEAETIADAVTLIVPEEPVIEPVEETVVE